MTNNSMVTEIEEMINGIKIVKSVQRGSTYGATTVTISAVDMNKTIVLSKSKSSAGYVASRGNISINTSGKISSSGSISGGTLSASGTYRSFSTGEVNGAGTTKTTIDVSGTIGGDVSQSGTVNQSGSASITGGTTDLTVKEYSAILTSSTTLSCDGKVEWQVIEFY